MYMSWSLRTESKPRARKAYEDSNEVLSEITTENPNKDLVVEEDKPKKKKEKQDEEL